MATVLIVGKPNVGKSTLFNKLVRKKKAIVEDEEGVTRDPVQDIVEWYGKTFKLVDTCGVFDNPQDIISQKMKEITLNMIREADLVLFVVDGKRGITKEDESLADFLRKSNVDTILVANKAENLREFEREVKPELYSLGFGEPIPVSAEHNINTRYSPGDDHQKTRRKRAGFRIKARNHRRNKSCHRWSSKCGKIHTLQRYIEQRASSGVTNTWNNEGSR